MDTKNIIINNDTLSLTFCRDGYWLYDKYTRMNLSMRANTERDAFIAAIDYYQKRSVNVENSYRSLRESVAGFVSQVHECDSCNCSDCDC